MKTNGKNRLLAVLAGTSALALGGALLCMNAPVAYAAENDEPNYVAFYNVGADDSALEIDTALGLAEKGVSATQAGTVTSGSTLLGSYAENAKYTVTLSGATNYRVSVIVKSGATVKIAGESVTSEGEGDNLIATKTVTGTSVDVEVDGKVCAILADDADRAATLIAVDYTAGQVIPYGAYLADVLENATGYYSDGVKEVKINYGDIVAPTGVDVNFTTVDVTGVVAGTELTVSRYLITMPDELIYFINGGSENVDNGRWEKSADPFYEYNETIFDYYKNGSGALKNDGTPDQKSTNNSWGWYGNSESAVTHTASAISFPYSSVRCMDRDSNANLGYRLTGLDQGEYRIWMGTLSPWHARTVTIKFNNEVVGEDNLRINSSKGYTVYEGVKPNASGLIDINLQGGSTNEPCVAFIAVQKMETEIDSVPSKLEGPSTIGMNATSVTVTGVREGAKLQIYNDSRPNQMLYEEKVDPAKISGGSYEINWGELYSERGISRFNIVQITNGGVSAPLLVAITDIELDEGAEEMTSVSLQADEYTTGTVTVYVKARANSGITKWSYRLGEYGTLHEFNLVERPYELDTSFTVGENGNYIVVVTSGLGVTREEVVAIGNIDVNRPEISITPSKEGWGTNGKFNVTLTVNSVAPVAEYKLLKDGELVGEAQTSAPATIAIDEEGEYTVYIKTASGMVNTNTFRVSEKPSVTTVTKRTASRSATFTFGNTEDFTVASVTAYLLTATGVQRQTSITGRDGYQVTVTSAGTYVVLCTTTTGETEIFSFDVTTDDLRAVSTGRRGNGDANTQLGVGLGVMIGGVVLAAAAVAVTFIFLKKKNS